MSNEAQNVFDRTLANRRKALVASNTQEQREAARESQRQFWTHQNNAPLTSTGIIMDDNLAALKRASDADRAAQRQSVNTTVPFIAPTVETITAIINHWKTQTANGRAYFDSAFNNRNMTLRIREQFELGALVQWSVEALDEVFTFLLANNFLETQFKTASIHPRGMPAPKPYPYVMPEEVAEEVERERAEGIAKVAAEIERARSLPLDQLQREMRQTFKSPKPGDPNLDRTY